MPILTNLLADLENKESLHPNDTGVPWASSKTLEPDRFAVPRPSLDEKKSGHR